jgi:hypothetical protein
MPVLDLTTKQHKYKVAVANSASTTLSATVADNVDILAITEVRRRAEKVKVETKVRLCVCDLKTPVCVDAEACSLDCRSALVTPLALTR